MSSRFGQGFPVNEPLEIQIANHLAGFLTAKWSLQEFREWFVPLSIVIEDSKNQAAIELAYRIDGILAEASSARWSDADLREELARVASPLVSLQS
jgi:hypothetical protein